MPSFIILWSHLLAASLYGVMAVFQLRHWNGDTLNRPLVSAFAVMSVWSIFLALLPNYSMLPQLAEAARNLAFLGFMYGIMQSAGEGGGQRSVKAVYAAVAAVVGLQIVIGGVISEYRGAPAVFEALAATSQMIGLTIAAGSLILVHNLYGQAAPASRGALRFTMIALSMMWAYDLHLYTVAYFTRGFARDLFAMRGIILALLIPLFILGVRATSTWKVQLSRAATFQSVSLILILAYLIVMMSASRALELVGGDWGRLAQLGIVVVMTVMAIVLLPSGRARGWFKVFVAKHVFEHRYDYRSEWLRFTDTVAGEDEESPSLETRVVKALADIGEAPAGFLMLADESYRLSCSVGWNWRGQLPEGGDGAETLARFVEDRAFVIDFAKLQDGWLVHGQERVPVPEWLTRIEGAWAGVPLIHSGRLAGLVVLTHPTFRRSLDWEDYDLFRAAGIHAASYIAEARSQQALADSRRFDEFNRRFAFILHDLKNLVSQLSLVARNAERHAEKPEFRADMIATLQNSVRKMNDLLARLSPSAVRDSEPLRPVSLAELGDRVATKFRHRTVNVAGDANLRAKADPAGLEQALSHLVQNAIEASAADLPIEIGFAESGGDVLIEVIDHGQGMSAEFIRTRLFQPFSSTKDNGFGLGAYEARGLVTAMGGRMEVDSREGQGTVFSLIFPQAEPLAAAEPKRMRA